MRLSGGAMSTIGALLRIVLGALVVLAPAFASGCKTFDDPELPPEGQVLLYVDTDAIVPLAPGETTDEATPAPIFDRLAIEMFAPGEQTPCAGCSREFGIDRRAFAEGRVSVGLLPRPGVAGYRARLVLYRAFRSPLAGPRPASSIVYFVGLPVTAAEGITSVHVVIRTEDLATTRGSLEAPLELAAGAPPKSLVDTWARAQRSTCPEAPREGEVCVPGGAFWMGDLTASVPAEQLVAISPFYLDATEITVARMRASPLRAEALRNSDVKEQAANKYCTYTASPGAGEDLPLTCVRRSFAGPFCEASGGRLPTEAELAYVASGRVGTPFVWGDDAPGCSEAIYGRGEPGQTQGARACASLGVGPAKVGSGTRDVLSLRTGKIFDLGGNVAEWVLDDYATLDTACWTSPILIDPRCEHPDKLPTFRGGAWNATTADLRAVSRGKLDAVGPDLGFRCARPITAL
jgi:sulfatase modifying factor 1